jgi:hypothetical protein
VDGALVVITLASLAAAAAALATACRVARRERQRSAARVAALVDAAGLWPEAGVRGAGSASANLFEAVQRPAGASRRLGLALGVGALLVGMAVASAIAVSRGGESRPTAASPAVQTAVVVDRLELVALQHERVNRTLTIAGIVRNPATGRTIEGLIAAVDLLDRDGSRVLHREVPLDCRVLAPGEESPFRVTLPETTAVERYRVSFRTRGRTVPHVDRRHQMLLATRAS